MSGTSSRAAGRRAKRSPAASQVERFSRRIERVFSRSMARAESQHDFAAYARQFTRDYDAAIAIIASVHDGAMLAALMDRYLALYVRYHANTDNVHYYRSDQTFAELFDQSTRVRAATRDVFAEWSACIDAKPKTDAGRRFRQRFDELSQHYRAAILAAEHKEKARRRTTRSILDTLKDEYIRQRGHPPASHADLYAFDPCPSPTLRAGLKTQRTRVQDRWTSCEVEHSKANVQALNTSLDAFLAYLDGVAKHDTLALFQVVKYLQDRMRTWRRPMRHGGTLLLPGDRSELGYELYAMACFELLAVANRSDALERNQYTFTAEEQEYFLHPIRVNNYPYISNLAYRFRKGLHTPHGNLDVLFGPTKTFLNLILIATVQLKEAGAALVPSNRTLGLQKTWKDIRDLTDRLETMSDADQKKELAKPEHRPTLVALARLAQDRLEVRGHRAELAKGVVRVGTQLAPHPELGPITVAYIDPTATEVFVEFAALKPNLFRVTRGYVEQKLYASRILDVARSTVGMVYLTNLMLLAMGFFPVLIESGFVALITEVAIYFGSSKVEELASRADPVLGKILGVLVMVFAPRPYLRAELPSIAIERPVRVLEVDTLESTRGFAEILAENENVARMTAELNRGTLKGIAARARDAVRDRVVALEQADWLSEISPSSAESMVTPEGVILRTGDEGATTVRGGAGPRTGGGAGATSRAETRLRNSPEFMLLEEYYAFLTEDVRLSARIEANAVLRKLRSGMRYSEALQKVRNLLNAAKEVTGEYVADGAVLSNFDVLKVYSAFSRRNGVPILDRVYKVRDYQTGKIDFLLVEVKGGERTNLGTVQMRTWSSSQRRLVPVKPERMVRQASGNWYYQRLIEMHESAPPGAVGRFQQRMAYRLFEAGRQGRLQTAIIKSGKELAPRITFNTDDVTRYLRSKGWPFGS